MEEQHTTEKNGDDAPRSEASRPAPAPLPQHTLEDYEQLLERISRLAQAFGTARELLTVYRALLEFTRCSVPSDGLFVSLYDPEHEVRLASYGWGDNEEIDVSALPPMPITEGGPNSRAIKTGEIVITDDYMNATRGNPGVIVGPDNGLRPQCSLAVPMGIKGTVVGTIEVQSYQRGAYRQEHIAAMRMAANLTAVAIENVRLLGRESRARAAAEASNRLKDEFLATVSHELRTPLTAIFGWTHMLEEGGLDQEAVTQALATIRRNARTQARIIDDILDVSRIITGQLALDLTPIEVRPVVEAAINVVRPTAEAKRIRIETEFDSGPAPVSGDGNRLQQVVWNLLSNAVKFTPAGGRVRVALRRSQATVEIEVSDTGQGIAPDFLPFVFDRFRQADSTTTRKHGGIGLGLAIARHLVEIHGGSVVAQSNGAGQGAAFTVTLPLVRTSGGLTDQKEGTAAARPARVPEIDGLHVLLVDDDEDTLELVAATLTRRRARVTSAISAEEAIACIRQSPPDVIVSDIGMPEVDGYELIRRIRALDSSHRSIPAVAMTAYARPEDRERALANGFQNYLAKPVEPAELISIIALAAGRERSDAR